MSRRCEARNTTNGGLCRNNALHHSNYCHVHGNPVDDILSAAAVAGGRVAAKGAKKGADWVRGKVLVRQASRLTKKHL